MCAANDGSIVYFMPTFFKDFKIPYYAVKCEEKMLSRQLEEMKKFFCQGVPDCVFDIGLKSCEANEGAEPTVGLLSYQSHFLQRVSIACYAKRCISYRKSVSLSVCPSVRLSVAGTVSKRLQLRSCGLHWRIAP